MRRPWQGLAMRDEFAQTIDRALSASAAIWSSSPATSGTWPSRGSPRPMANASSTRASRNRTWSPSPQVWPTKGILPWVYSIAPFVAFRPYEQIRTDVCLHKLPVKLVGNGGGYGYGIMGATHHALEDVGAMRVLPNMRLYLPLTAADVPVGREHDGAGSAAELLASEYAPPTSRERLLRLRRGERSSPGRKCVVIGMGPVLGNLYEMGDRGPCSTTSRSGTWGCSPSTRFRPTSSRASRKSSAS